MLSRWMLALLVLVPLRAAAPPAEWVPARWPWNHLQTLDLLDGTPVNCLLLGAYSAEFAAKAAERNLATLAVLTPAAADPVAEAAKAAAAGLDGVVLEGDFPPDTAARVKDALAGGKAIVIELGPRHRMRLGSAEPVVGTYQGVWPGVQVLEDGAHKSGPTGAPWIDTNSGFIRAVRAWGHDTVWLANQPPEKTVIPAERYLQAIADAAMSGGRWVLALDSDFQARLLKRDAAAVRDWQRIGQHLRFYESRPEWRKMRPYGKLAVVQDPSSGALLSGGILDMIAAKHTPVRPVPRPRLSPEALKDASLTVNVDPEALTPEQREILRGFARGGGTLLTAPSSSNTAAPPRGEQITLEKAELERLHDLWRDVQSMIGRRNLGVRLFNVSSMLSNVLAAGDGGGLVVHLVNYSGYPVENIAAHFLGKIRRARLLTPGGAEKELEVYPTEDGAGVDIPEVGVCAALRLE